MRDETANNEDVACETDDSESTTITEEVQEVHKQRIVTSDKNAQTEFL